MSFTDPIGDLITRIRNGQSARKSMVVTPASKAREAVLDVLKREGYINGYETTELRKNVKQTRIDLRYVDGAGVIAKIERVSKPGRRVYQPIADLPRYFNGLGISVLSTSRGVLSDQEAREQNVGGEVLIRVF